MTTSWWNEFRLSSVKLKTISAHPAGNLLSGATELAAKRRGVSRTTVAVACRRPWTSRSLASSRGPCVGVRRTTYDARSRQSHTTRTASDQQYWPSKIDSTEKKTKINLNLKICTRNHRSQPKTIKHKNTQWQIKCRWAGIIIGYLILYGELVKQEPCYRKETARCSVFFLPPVTI